MFCLTNVPFLNVIMDGNEFWWAMPPGSSCFVTHTICEKSICAESAWSTVWESQDHPQAQWFAGRTHRTQELMVCPSERIQIKVIKGKMHMGRSPGKSSPKLLGDPSHWNHTGTHLVLPEMMCDNRCEVLPTREAHLSLGIQGFHWNPVTWQL